MARTVCPSHIYTKKGGFIMRLKKLASEMLNHLTTKTEPYIYSNEVLEKYQCEIRTFKNDDGADIFLFHKHTNEKVMTISFKTEILESSLLRALCTLMSQFETMDKEKYINPHSPYLLRKDSSGQTYECYNKEYGDNRICKCGHKYFRHFDTYDNYEPVGCKYCACERFEEAEPIANEMTITGWFYKNTSAVDNATALAEFNEACEIIGINDDNVQSVIIRDTEGNDITKLEKPSDMKN